MRIFKKYIDQESENKSESFGVRILNLGHNVHPPYKEYPEQNHPEGYNFNWKKGRYLKEYQLIYISGGKGTFEVNGLPEQKIGPGTVFLLFPDIWHRFHPDLITGWEEYWVGFTGDYAKYLLEQKCFSPENPIIDVGFIPQFLETFFKQKYGTQQKKIGQLTEYFSFSDEQVTLILKDLNLLKYKVLPIRGTSAWIDWIYFNFSGKIYGHRKKSVYIKDEKLILTHVEFEQLTQLITIAKEKLQ